MIGGSEKFLLHCSPSRIILISVHEEMLKASELWRYKGFGEGGGGLLSYKD